MYPYSSRHQPEIAVIGRCSFGTGIGAMSFAACEMLARSFPVSIIPTEPHLRHQGGNITLPNGRLIPICQDTSRVKVSFFTDVLWNGVSDFNYNLCPENSLKYAWLVYDSDRLPARWTQLLNTHFDLVVATSPHLIDVARDSGVRNPMACMPIPLDLEALLSTNIQARDSTLLRFGSIVAFHPRKETLTLIEAFRQAFGGASDSELVLHSNLAFGTYIDAVREAASTVPNVRISYGNLSEAEKNQLLGSLDVFVNCSRGEGYSIGAREALALGKPLVLSQVGAHNDLAGVPGVILVPANRQVPARYPEIDNEVFGSQRVVTASALAEALVASKAYCTTTSFARDAGKRRVAAQNSSFSALATSFGTLLNPQLAKFRLRATPWHVAVPPEFTEKVDARLGRRCVSLSEPRHQVCPAYDGGFFSIFNAFMSHLVWQQHEERCHAVYPDWDVDRLISRLGNRQVMSFCYGQPGDGNLWLHLFEPLFGCTKAEMNDPSFLYDDATIPASQHNETREPLMTYVHAFELYKTTEFARWRRQYHKVFKQHVKLIASLQTEIDRFASDFLNRPYLIAAHVRHPSHTVEQPGAVIAHEDAYIAAVRRAVRNRGLNPEGNDWRLFLATDQDRVVRRFQAEFGERVACFDDVRRTRASEDAMFDALPQDEKNKEGHQLQHLVAADRANWSVRMAQEVVRDAYAMARCNTLLHVVSNVSTAAAYMNPELEMVFCAP